MYVPQHAEPWGFLTIHLMRSKHNTTILSILTYHIPRKATAERVHPRRRFVKKNCLAFSTKRNCKAQLPLHSAAQVLRQCVSFFKKGDILNRLVDFRVSIDLRVLGVQSFNA
jgi:hypothetical protein